MSKSEFSLNKISIFQLLEKLENSLKAHDLWTKKLLLGVSGGLDSMALLTALKELDQQVFVVHLNYGLRGEDSDADQELVEYISEFYGFEAASFSVNYSEEAGNLQAWARKLRYEYFEALRIEEHCNAIVLAHHMDDQVETLVQKIFRSSSPQSWNGMKSWDEQRFLLRPWLSIRKEEIASYSSSKAIPFREDTSNKESKYNRNWIRNRWKPELDEYFPGWERNILGMQAYADLLGQYRNQWLAQYSSTRRKEDNSYLSIPDLVMSPKMMQQDLIKAFIEAHPSFEAGEHLSAGMLVQIVNLLEAETGSMVPISQKLIVYTDREYLRIAPAHMFSKPKENEPLIKFDQNSLPLVYSEYTLRLEVFDQETEDLSNRKELCIDVQAVRWPLKLRAWIPGDRFRPLGMKGHMKISDFLVNRRVPRHQKSLYLVIEDSNNKIIAVLYPSQNNNEIKPIGSPSEYYKCTKETQQILRIESLEP